MLFPATKNIVIQTAKSLGPRRLLPVVRWTQLLLPSQRFCSLTNPTQYR